MWSVAVGALLWIAALYAAFFVLKQSDLWALKYAYDRGRKAYRELGDKTACGYHTEIFRQSWRWGYSSEEQRERIRALTGQTSKPSDQRSEQAQDFDQGKLFLAMTCASNGLVALNRAALHDRQALKEVVFDLKFRVAQVKGLLRERESLTQLGLTLVRDALYCTPVELIEPSSCAALEQAYVDSMGSGTALTDARLAKIRADLQEAGWELDAATDPDQDGTRAEAIYRNIVKRLEFLKFSVSGKSGVPVAYVVECLRQDIKGLQRMQPLGSYRRFSLGTMYDALCFTDDISEEAAQLMSDFFRLVFAGPITRETYLDIRDKLEEAGWELYAVPRDRSLL